MDAQTDERLAALEKRVAELEVQTKKLTMFKVDARGSSAQFRRIAEQSSQAALAQYHDDHHRKG